MATYTQNYNLEKPSPDEFYNVGVQNSNMDKIDAHTHTAAQVGARPDTWTPNLAQVGGSNHNLLDNPWFTVDQRGGYVVSPGTTYYFTGGETVAGTTDAYYTVKSVNINGNATFAIDGVDYWCIGKGVRGYTGEGYTTDRWYSYKEDTTTLITEDGLQLINNNPSNYIEFVQRVLSQQLIGKTVTASCLTASNELVTGHTTIYAGMDVNVCSGSKIRLNLIYRLDGILELRFLGDDTETIKAVKLELGSTQTLAHQENGVWVLNEIPDYVEQLAKCQRYYCKPRRIVLHRTLGTNSFTVVAGFTAEMRDHPTALFTSPLTAIVPGKTVSASVPISFIYTAPNGNGDGNFAGNTTPADADIFCVDGQISFSADL